MDLSERIERRCDDGADVVVCDTDALAPVALPPDPTRPAAGRPPNCIGPRFPTCAFYRLVASGPDG